MGDLTTVVLSSELLAAHLTISGVLGFVLIISLIKFSKIRTQLRIIKREGNLVYLVGICASITLIITWPLIYLLHIIPQDKYPLMFEIVGYMGSVLYQPIAYFSVFCILLRYWMLMYEFNVVTANDDMKWKQIIDCCADVSDEKWLLKHHSTLGNKSFMFKWGTVFTLFYACVAVTISMLVNTGIISVKYQPIIDFPYFAFASLTVFMIRYYSPEYGDTIHINCELKSMSKVFLFTLILYVVAVILEYGFGYKKVGFTHFAGILAFFLMAFLPIIHFFMSHNCDCSGTKDKCTVKYERYKSKFDSKMKGHNLKTSLTSNNYYVLFMYHLMSELSMELLLSFTEFEQFRQYSNQLTSIEQSKDTKRPSLTKSKTVSECSSNCSTDPLSPHHTSVVTPTLTMPSTPVDTLQLQQVISDSASLPERESIIVQFKPKLGLDDIIFGDDIPKSGIVYRYHEDKNIEKYMKLKLKIYDLYKKYIEIGSKYEINIPYNQRNKFMDLMGNKQKWLNNDILSYKELTNIFVRPGREMYKLMNDGHRRFKNTTKFKNAFAADIAHMPKENK